MQVLVIGSKGMLGTDVVRALNAKNYAVTAWDLNEIDITKADEMEKVITQSPQVVINCAAYTNVDLAETEKEKCRLINTVGVENLVLICKKIGAILVHISTDYVFDGTKESYDENDSRNPINYYGKTKADAEDFIEKNLKSYYIVRTSWLVGKNGKNFVETIIKNALERGALSVVDDQIGRPTFTKDLSGAIVLLLDKKKPFGIYNITNFGKCSWFEFAKKIVQLKKINCAISPCTTAQYPRPAKRPKFSVLNNNKLPNLRSWEEALEEYIGG